MTSRNPVKAKLPLFDPVPRWKLLPTAILILCCHNRFLCGKRKLLTLPLASVSMLLLLLLIVRENLFRRLKVTRINILPARTSRFNAVFLFRALVTFPSTRTAPSRLLPRNLVVKTRF
jgi:hypothetical protein